MIWRRKKDRGAVAHRSHHAAFRRARLHLTAWYVATLAVIVLAFSIALYVALAAQLQQRQQHHEGSDLPDVRVERETSNFALGRLRLLLIGGNIVLLAGAAVGAYFLADKTLQPIGAALERQRRFTAGASHELRTPLTIMRGNLDVTLQRERSPAEYRQRLAELGEEIDTLTQLTEQLLRLARGSSPSAAAICDLRPILEDVVRSTASLAQERRSTVALALASSLITLASPLELRQVFLNLVLNAIQHTPAGTTIRVTGKRREQTIEVTVSDNGPGIPPDQREDIFLPFYRRKTTGSDGTGLGLTLVAEMVKAAGGSISVMDTVGGGATFAVRLPAEESKPS